MIRGVCTHETVFAIFEILVYQPGLASMGPIVAMTGLKLKLVGVKCTVYIHGTDFATVVNTRLCCFSPFTLYSIYNIRLSRTQTIKQDFPPVGMQDRSICLSLSLCL
jgi:hypothetical protein